MSNINEQFEQGVALVEKRMCEDALKIFKKIGQDERQSILKNEALLFKINYYMGVCQFELSQITEAKRSFETVLTIAENRPWYADKLPYITSSYNYLGACEIQQKVYKKGVKWYKKAAELYQEQSDLQSYAITINNIGGIYLKQFQIQKAIGAFEIAINLQNQLLQQAQKYTFEHDRELYLANNYNNLSSVFGLQGDYKVQIIYLKQALIIAHKYNNIKYTVKFYNNIIWSYKRLREYDQQLELCLKYVAFCEEHESKEIFQKNNQLSRVYNRLGMAYFDKKKYLKALEILEKAKAVITKEEKGFETILFGNLTLVYLAQNQLQEAQNAIQEALRLIEQSNDLIDYGTIIDIYLIHVEFLAIKNKYSKAFEQFTKVLSLLNGKEEKDITISQILEVVAFNIGYDLIKTLKTLSAILDLYAQHYKELPKVSINLILAYCRKSIDLIDHLRKTYSAERSKLILAEKAAIIYDNTITILYRLYQETKEDILLEVIFECMEKSKAMVLLGTMQDNTAKQQSGIPQADLEEEQRLRKRLTAYENALQKENAKKTKDDATIKQLENLHFDATEIYQKLIEQFEKDYPNYHQLKYAIKTAKILDVQKMLHTNMALVSYFVGEYQLTIFVISHQSVLCEQIEITKNELLSENGRKGLVKDLQKAINKSIDSRDVEQCTIYAQNAFACFDYLLAPIMDKLPENITTLRIIPDVVLGSIPFEALVTKMPNQDINSTYNQLWYLAHDYAIAYHYSATLWHYQQVQKSKILVRQSSKQSKRFTGKYTAFVPSYEGTRYGNLSYTLTEAKNIGTMLVDKNAMEQQFFVGENATKAAFEANCQESQVIVFAGHGNYNTKQPSKSGLIFTPIQKGKEDAEVLKLSEVYNLQLKANVVLLGACKSGKGDLAIGEGVMGVNRGFLYAGAKNVLFTLFNVPDESASELSTAFFRAVIEQPSLNYAKALQTAKKQLLSNSNYTPKHWSGLVLIGE